MHAIPQIQTLLNEAAKRGEPLGRIASQLQELLDVHGRTPMTAAVADALHRGVPHPNAVRLALERQRQAQTPPPLGIRANLRPFPPFDLPFRVIFKFKFDGRSALYLPCPFGQASR